MRVSYGKDTRQTGYTDGHTCIKDSDKNTASEQGASLLYGEVLPEGVLKLMDEHHLRAAAASTLIDMGMGTGKLLFQTFLCYPNLTRVSGIELARSRYDIAEAALMELSRLLGGEIEAHEPGTMIRMRTHPTCCGGLARTLELHCGSMWGMTGVPLADIIVMHTDLTETSVSQLRKMIQKVKVGCRFVTYQDLTPYWRRTRPPFEQVDVNIDDRDTFLTSWSSAKGFHLYCWEKVRATPGGFRAEEEDYDGKEAVS
jgi:hypothetical protein